MKDYKPEKNSVIKINNNNNNNYKDKDKDKKVRKNNKSKINVWAVQIFFLTFVLSLSFSILSEVLLSKSNVVIAFTLLTILIIINILFDVISIAVTSCNIEPFLSMAAKKIKGSKIAVKLIKNAEKVNNICSDVIGDICGIITGALGATIVLKMFAQNGSNADTAILSILFSSITAALIVGGKAVGKRIALNSNQEIIYFVARVLSVFSKKNNDRKN